MNDEQNALLSKNKWKQCERANQTEANRTKADPVRTMYTSNQATDVKQKKAGEK